MKAFWLLLASLSTSTMARNGDMRLKNHIRSGSTIAHRLLQDGNNTGTTAAAEEEESSSSTPMAEAENAALQSMSEKEQKDQCLQDTAQYLKDTPVVQNAADAYAGGMQNESNQDGDGLKIGFPEEAVAGYKQTCDENGGYWSFLEDAQFTCRSEQLQERQNMEVYGMGNCLAPTQECQAMDPVHLMESVWDSLGLECTLAGDDVGDGEGDEASDPTEEQPTEGSAGGAGDDEEPAAATEPPADEENPPANDNEGESGGGEETPEGTNSAVNDEDGDDGEGDTEGDEVFMSDEDAACLDSTEELMNAQPELLQAMQDYQEAVSIDGADDTETQMTMSYGSDAVAVAQKACGDAGGYWALLENEDFICSMMGIDQHLEVKNFGSCLADTQNCQSLDIGHMLESVWDVMGLSCWGSNDEGFPGDDAEGSGGGAGDGNAGENPDDADDFDTPPDIDDLDLPEGDKQCIADTQAMAQTSPEIDDASAEFGKSMQVNMKDMSDLKMGFPDVEVAKLSKACNATDGYFSFVKTQYFDCDMGGFKNVLKVYNIADCLADTDECKAMNPLRLMETVWQSMGLQCTEKSGDDNDTGGGGSGGGSDNDKPNGGGGGGNPEITELGLSESEVACMNDSDGFVQSDDQINLAAQTYAEAVEMNDPTKLGFPADAAANMEKVCDENGGLWSAIDSQDVTCMIQGRERRINVYNFGNCLSNTNHCQTMDPMVLVKAFFWEVLHFKCWPKGEPGHGGSSTHNNPHTGGDSGSVGSMQNTSTASSADDGMQGWLTAIVVLVVVVAIGFGVMFKLRGRHGRERIRQYEMSDVSDLRFDSFT